MFVIVQYSDLGDQWECDGDRTPIALVDDWHKWREENTPDFSFEVYESRGEELDLIREHDAYEEWGMVLGSLDEEEEVTILQKFPNRTRDQKIPKTVQKIMTKDELWDCLDSCGNISWETDGVYHFYGEYCDNQINTGI